MQPGFSFAPDAVPPRRLRWISTHGARFRTDIWGIPERALRGVPRPVGGSLTDPERLCI